MDFGNLDTLVPWTLGDGFTLGSGMALGDVVTIGNQAFERKTKASTRHPTFSVFVETYGDITEIVQSYSFKRTLVGGTNMIAEPNYGTGSIVIIDPDGDYIDNGRAVFRRGKKVFIFAGFEDDNIPRFSGIIRSVDLQSDLKTMTLSIADDGYRMRTARTGGDKSAYPTPKLLIDHLASEAGIGEVIYDNETGRPSTVEFGDTLLETRTYWAMVHGSTLLLGYRQFFDEKGRLNIVSRYSYEDSDYIFTDDDQQYFHFNRNVDIINHRFLGITFGLTLPFLCGTVTVGAGSSSRTHSLSKRKYGEYSNAETDELIGTVQNAEMVTNQDLEYTAFPRELYLMRCPGLPQLQLNDRIFLNLEGQNISGYYDIVEIDESGAAGNLNNVFTLMNQGDRF